MDVKTTAALVALFGIFITALIALISYRGKVKLEKEKIPSPKEPVAY